MVEQDDTNQLSPAESLALIDQQRQRVARTIEPDPVLIFGVWGVAWLLGFAALYLAYRGALPLVAGGLAFFVVIVTALVITALHMTRAFRGVAGVSARAGAMHGWTWLVGFGCTAAVQAGVTRTGLTDDQGALLGPALPLLVVGLLYMAGGSMWQDRVQYTLGIWILVTNAAGIFAGVPGNYLVLTLAGGGGFLVAAAWLAWQRRRRTS